MSYHCFFSMSVGLAGPIRVPKGTYAEVVKHVEEVTETLGLKVTQYLDNNPHWQRLTPPEGVPDKIACETVDRHNCWVVWFYGRLCKWSERPPEDGEEITPEQMKAVWYGLSRLTVPPERWTEDYYVSRMESLYEVMRGREDDGVSFDEKPLTPKQANAVVKLFSVYLDPGDTRLEVAEGNDHLSGLEDYTWCEKCGAINNSDIGTKVRHCRKRVGKGKGCPIRAEYGEEYRRD